MHFVNPFHRWEKLSRDFRFWLANQMEYAYWFEVWTAVKSHLSNPKTNEIIHFDNYIQMVRSMIIVFTMRSYADLMLIAAAMLKSGWKECSMHHFQISFHTHANRNSWTITAFRFLLAASHYLASAIYLKPQHFTIYYMISFSTVSYFWFASK